MALIYQHLYVPANLDQGEIRQNVGRSRASKSQFVLLLGIVLLL